MHPPDHEDWGEESVTYSEPRPHNWVANVRRIWRRHWQPEEIEPPAVDPELPCLTAAERSAEVMRYAVLKAEHWLSPKGLLREWLRFNARVAIALAVPALLVAPLVTFALGQFNAWALLLAQTTSNMVLFPLSALLVVGLISGLVYVAKSIMTMRLRYQQQQQRPYY